MKVEKYCRCCGTSRGEVNDSQVLPDQLSGRAYAACVKNGLTTWFLVSEAISRGGSPRGVGEKTRPELQRGVELHFPYSDVRRIGVSDEIDDDAYALLAVLG